MPCGGTVAGRERWRRAPVPALRRHMALVHRGQRDRGHAHRRLRGGLDPPDAARRAGHPRERARRRQPVPRAALAVAHRAGVPRREAHPSPTVRRPTRTPVRPATTAPPPAPPARPPRPSTAGPAAPGSTPSSPRAARPRCASARTPCAWCPPCPPAGSPSPPGVTGAAADGDLLRRPAPLRDRRHHHPAEQGDHPRGVLVTGRGRRPGYWAPCVSTSIPRPWAGPRSTSS